MGRRKALMDYAKGLTPLLGSLLIGYFVFWALHDRERWWPAGFMLLAVLFNYMSRRAMERRVTDQLSGIREAVRELEWRSRPSPAPTERPRDPAAPLHRTRG